MRRLAKKFAASVLALTLVVAMGTQCFAATWGSYFGASAGWYEGAEGSLTNESATGWTANLDSLGWGGIWGAQVYQNAGEGFGKIDVKKGQTYALSFTMTSSNCDKWVYIKISNGDGKENLAYAKWIQLKRGTAYKFSETFTAQSNASTIYFGLGGEMGDREGVDEDAAIRYSYAPNGASSVIDTDPTAATKVTLSNFSLGSAKPAKVTLKSVKAVKGRKVKVTYKKATGAAGYQIKYTVKGSKAKTKTTTKTTYTLKKLKKGKKVTVQVRAYAKGKKIFGAWSKKKSVKVK